MTDGGDSGCGAGPLTAHPIFSVRAMRTLAAFAALALLAGCSAETRVKHGKEYFSEKEYGVKASPRVIALGQPAPKGGGRVITGEPYQVRGKWYYPDDPQHIETGLASWYGSAFHGRLTANGEVYDVNGITAAHPTMPLPSYARVTNIANGRSIVVRVNDRGPYAHDRVIDLSSRVADILGTKGRGVERVRVQYVGPARMDGRDENVLMASYRVGGGSDTMIAAAPKRRSDGVQLASFSAPAPAPRLKPRFEPANTGWDSIDDVIYGDAEHLAPDRAGYAVPPANGGDPIGRLIRPAKAIRSYAPDGLEDGIIDPATTESLRRAQSVARRVDGEGAVVQAGVFANPANAERLAKALKAYGRVEITPVTSGGRVLQLVRVRITDPSVRPEQVVALIEVRAGPAVH